ncbi:MAG TPA: AAA family ATPase, partial [Blastocatellia bacterium]|nr:AAA family ATPase [Blastocatellia bacterium]
YLPVLEALNHLLTGDAKLTVEKQEPLRRAMKQLAPNWYVQAAPLSAADEQLLDERRVHSQERLKRELGAFFQEISRLHPIVLFIDDLQWADSSTIDLLAYLAGKFDAMRMLVVVNYRESDLLLARHPFLQLKRDLQARGLCHEIRLQFLSRDEIENYLALEFPDHRFPQNLPALIHSKTEGSPLFMADLARYLRYRNVITQEHGRWVLAQSLPEVERELPESVRGMIERKIAQLTEEDRLLLVAASVQGDEFDSAVVAKVLGSDAADFEERLDELESVHSFVRLIEEREFPDRTLTQRYRFVHVLYQNALYNSLRPTRKAQLSAAVARALEGYWGERSAGIANELAVLWEAAREYARAAEYFRLAAQNASQVFASREAVVLVRRGLALLESLPDTRERSRQELPLQVVLGNVLVATNGFVSQEVEMTYSRARVLCQQLDDTTHLLPVLYGLHAHHTTGGDLRGALEIGDEFLKLAQRQNDPAIIVAHGLLGVTLVIMAEFTRAREHLEQSVSQYDPARHRSLTWLYTQEPGMAGRAWLIWTLWALGYADQALARESEALQLSREVMHANSQAYALFHSALHHQFRREVQIVRELAETMIPLAEGQGMAWWLQIGMFMRGWVMSEQGLAAEGIDEMRRSLDAQKSLGAETSWPYELCLLGEANGKVGQLSEAFALLDEAQKFVDKYGARYWEAELHRTRGELLLKSDPGHRTSAGGSSQPKAEECFHRAISIARQQEAKSLELRAVMGLARLWRQQGKRAEAHKTLAEIYGWFTEGFDTADLIEAKNLLDQLT